MREFNTFYEQHILRRDAPGAPDDADELQICFSDGCGLLALVYHDRDDASDKSTAEFMNSAKKAGFKGVNSLVIANSFGRKLPAAFGKSATGISKTPLPGLKTFKDFDTQMKTTSFKHELEGRVREKAKLLILHARNKMSGDATQMAIACISAAEQFVLKLLDWMANHYHQMNATSGAEVDSSAADWDFISSAVKAIFRELQLLCSGGQMNPNPGNQAWAMMSTMTLQEKLCEDFNTHKIVVDESYAHVQKNGVLKIEFTQQIEAVKSDIKKLEKHIHNVASTNQKKKDKENGKG